MLIIKSGLISTFHQNRSTCTVHVCVHQENQSSTIHHALVVASWFTNQCSHHGFPALGQMVLALGFIGVVTRNPFRFGQGESIISLCCLTPQIYDSSKYSDSDCPSLLFSRPQIPHCIATWENQGRVLSGITKSELEGGQGFCLL